MNIAAVLLDIDGTLVDSNDLHARAWVDAFAESGLDVPFDRVRPLLGTGGDKLLPAIDPSLSDASEPGKTIARRRGEIFKTRYFDAVRPFDDVRELLTNFRQCGVKCVVATSATSAELGAMLKVASIEDLIDVAVTSEDVHASKPAPDIVGTALKKAKVSAKEAVMLGDTRFDIEAARSAGVDCIALRCGGSPEDDLAGAIAVFEDPAALHTALKGASLDQIIASAGPSHTAA